MCVQHLCLWRSNLVEAVHVELSHEGLEIGMFEVEGQYPFRKAFGIMHNESRSFWVPADSIIVLAALHYHRGT